MKSLDKYVIFSIAILIVYAIVERTISAITGIPADTLTACFYAAFGGEILTCGLIKIFKLKEGDNGNNDDNVIGSIGFDDPNDPGDQSG